MSILGGGCVATASVEACPSLTPLHFQTCIWNYPSIFSRVQAGRVGLRLILHVVEYHVSLIAINPIQFPVQSQLASVWEYSADVYQYEDPNLIITVIFVYYIHGFKSPACRELQ